MAVQQNKSTRSKKKMRRSHDNIKIFNLSREKVSGEIHIRHHMTRNGYYRGKKFILKNDSSSKN
ncbi:50S ribosomal protein L32 [Candidatus Riesia sp. GBBU]|nr:50S ribosomal protein L32 [Candidatus Riesia sp. GBBU]